MTDNAYAHPRLAKLYDGFEGDRSDLDCYVEVLSDAGVRSVLDVGCGTGVFALRLSDLGLEVTGVDPGAGVIDVARAKPGADAVRWIVGEAADALPIQVDAVTMTANVAMVFTSDDHWEATLQAIHAALRPGGLLAFESRNPADRGWDRWGHPCMEMDVADERIVTSQEVTSVNLPLVTFVDTNRFLSDGEVLTSTSTLRFREEAEIRTSLKECGFTEIDVRDLPYAPGRGWLVVCRKPAGKFVELFI